MPIRNLDKIFRPKSIAIIGASSAKGKVGNTVLQNLIVSGYKGALFPINPKYKDIEGLRAFTQLADLPTAADLAIVCTPAETIPQIVRECGDSGTRGMIILSAGFREMGAHGVKLEQAVLGEAKRFPGLRIIGPNYLHMVPPTNKIPYGATHQQ